MANIKFSELPNLGNITAGTIVPVVASGVNYSVTAANLQTYSTNAVSITPASVSATGNITGNYILGNGSLLTGVAASYGNANVSAFLPTYTGNIGANTITATGNINAAAGNITGDLKAGFFIGNGSQLTGLYGNANVAAYLPTYTGAITALTGNVTTTANVSGAYLLGNIAAATGGYGNANVQAVLQTYTGSLTAASLSTTGNITGSYLFGNGSQLTGINVATTYNNSNVAAFLPTYTGNMVAMTGNVTTTANIQGAYIKGNGSALTGLVTSIAAGTGISISQATGNVTITNSNPTPYTDANVAAFLPTYSGALKGSSLSVTGTTTSGSYAGNGAGLSSIVTSITAGSGISVNATTGAITITATGGGGSGNSISNGTSNVSVPTANGVVTVSTNNVTAATFTTYAGSNVSGVIKLGVNGAIQAGTMYLCNDTATLGSSPNITLEASSGNGVFAGRVQGASIYGTTLSAGTITVTNGSAFTINSGALFTQAQTTKTGTGTGTVGQIVWDSNYIYVCTATNVWKRVVLSSF
jgi:hypothetical protein